MICCQWQLGKSVWKITNCANRRWTDNPLSHHQGLWVVAARWGEDEEWKISVKGVRGTCCSRCSKTEDIPLPWGFAFSVPSFLHFCSLASQQIQHPSSSASDYTKSFNSTLQDFKFLQQLLGTLLPSHPYPLLYLLLSVSLHCDLDRRQKMLCCLEVFKIQ